MKINIKRLCLIALIFTLLASAVALCSCMENVYKITYVADGKTVGTQMFTVKNTNIYIPSVPEKAGYTGEWENFTLKAEDMTVNAVYTIIEYTVTFKAGDKVVATRTYTVENQEITVPQVPAMAGFSGEWIKFELTAGDITVNAIYTAKHYTVSLDYDGATGSNTKQTITVDYAQQVGYKLPTPTKDDAYFDGWFFGNISITPMSFWMYDVDEPVIFAKWREPTQGLDYYLNADGESYTVSGKGSATDADIFIPWSYDGKPVTGIGEMAFNACSWLTSIALSSNIETIGDSAFFGCGQLTNITFPDSIDSIGDNAFAFSGLTSVVIPDKVTHIGSGVFANCSNLTSIVVHKDNPCYYSVDNSLIESDSRTLLAVGVNNFMPDDGSIAIIGDYVFAARPDLLNVTLPYGVNIIGNSAFYGCGYLESIIIPTSVISIGTYAFSNCVDLKSINIPRNVVSIGDYALSVCESLTNISVALGNAKYHSSGNCLIETESKTLLTGCSTSVIPDDGSVTAIYNQAFDGCSNLTSIVIPEGITSIGRFAFSGCGLNIVIISNSVTSIGEYAFQYCRSLSSLMFNGTIAEWNQVSKDANWNNGSDLKRVECTNGEVVLKAEHWSH